MLDDLRGFFEWLISPLLRSERIRLINDLRSRDRRVSLAALEKLRRRGWLANGALAYADLRYADLHAYDLSGADLRGADLRRANLWEADLSRACLAESRLTQTDLEEANLQRADLRGANVWGANLHRATLPDGGRWHEGLDMARYTDPRSVYYGEPPAFARPSLSPPRR